MGEKTYMEKKGIINRKAKAFALRVIRLYKFLIEEKKEFVISKQVLRCGTSIGANLTESIYAQSSADFVSKSSIALKEAAETEYWLELLYESGYIDDNAFKSISEDCSELIKLLTSRRIKTTKSKN